MGKKIIQSARVSLSGSDDKTFPVAQIQAYGQAADALVIWPYGMHGSLPVDSYAISFSINGQQEFRGIIGYKPDLRKKNLKSGEVIFGNFMVGSTVFFDEDGNITIECENDKIINIKGDANITVEGTVTITAPTVIIDGNLQVNGETSLGEVVTSDGTNISNTHKHSGVSTGGSNTGNPT